MRNALHWLENELLELLPVWLFFLFAFALLSLTQTVLLRDYGLRRSGPSMVLIGSLIVAKAFLIVDHLKVTNRFRAKPLAFAIVWKTAIYVVGVFTVWYLEQLVDLTLHHFTFAEANFTLLKRMSTDRFLVVVVWMIVLLFAFSGTREIVRVLGKARFMAILFGTPEGPETKATQRAA